MCLFEVSEGIQTKKGNFLKVGKFTYVIFVIMLIVAVVSVFNVKPTTVENTNVSAGYVKASQTYVLVLNFTINTTSDTLLVGLGPSDGQILENDNQSTDWGGAGKMLYYDNSSGSEGGSWDADIDCIFLDDVTSDEQYNDTETVLAGSAPPIGTNASGLGCKNMSAWHRVKSYDAADGGVWNAAADAIIFEGEDNNTCYHEELNAVTFKLNSTCNGTSSDISDLTFWVENTGGGFSSSDDTLLGNASFSADSFSWNISSLTQDINVTATFYAAVNLSATAVHWNTIRMDIPTKIDNATTGSYTNNDQGLFLAGTNDTGNIVNTNNLTIDDSTPTATVSVPVDGNYYNSLTSVSGSCNDSVSDISSVNITVFNVTGDAFYNGSSSAWQSSVSWISTTLGGDYDSWSYDTSGVTWTNNSLYFVNATATDNASNSGSNDSNSFTFDSGDPTISSLSPGSGSSTTNTQPTISAALSDSRSGVDDSSVIIKVDNVNQTSNATVTSTSISYTPASALSYASHTVNITVSDNAGNTGYSEWSFTVYEGGGSGGGTPSTRPLILNVDHNPDEPTKNDTVTINATVIARGTNSIASVTLNWNDSTEHSKAMTLADETNGIYSTQIGPFQELTTVTYYIVATDDADQDTTATDDDYTFTVADATGPSITIDMPTNGSTIYDTTPTIKASYSDISGIDADSVTLTIDEVTVTPTITSTLVTYTPTTNMTFGEHNVEVNVSDILGNSATKNWSFTILQSESISEEEVGNVTSGEETEVEPENSDETGIEGIMFTAAADLTNVKITVVKLSGKPEYIAEDPTKVVAIYAYLEIGITADDKYVADDDIESLKISFKVEQTWMEENNIDRETIVLMKYHNNEWQKLSTTVISEDAVYVHFESETTGFSTFAIAVSEGEEPTEELETPGLPLLIIIIGAIIAAIIIIIVILYKKGYINIR